VELVLLADFQKSYASDWMRVANTEGVKDIRIGDRFREQGFGAGAEELEVDGLGISEVGGLSRLHVIRAANATQPEVHRLGAVFLQVGIKAAVIDPTYQPLREIINGTDAVVVTSEPFAGLPERLQSTAGTPEAMVAMKRGRGRPKGSKNVVKEEVAFPAGF
jgi:hypothetical protein